MKSRMFRPMGFVVAVTLWMTGGAGGQAATENPGEPRLQVRPVLCIADRQAGNCPTMFQIDWRSPRPGAFCLGSDNQQVPLRCWEAAMAGEHREYIVVTQDFYYWLTAPNSSRKLSPIKVELLRLHGEDRRRERRSRHVWDVL